MFNLYLRNGLNSFTLASPSPETYAAAITSGQTLVGPGNFYIDTGTRVPSREEQLGLPVNLKKNKKQEILDEL